MSGSSPHESGLRRLALRAADAALSRGVHALRQLRAPAPPVRQYRRDPLAAELARAIRERPGLNLVGYPDTPSGVGESLRACARAASAVGLPFEITRLGAPPPPSQAVTEWSSHISGRAPHPVTILHVNADNLPQAYDELSSSHFDGSYTVGLWHWELPRLPERWWGSFELISEVWAPSRFVQEAVSQVSPLPVALMPHAVAFEEPTTDPAEVRRRLGLPTDRFLVLTMFDFPSVRERKNPAAALEAFSRAFPEDGQAALVIKVHRAERHEAELRELEGWVASRPHVTLLERTLSREEVLELEASCDAFLSLHRSEGFGLVLAECMFMGKPVVATHWSANTDFMTSHNSCPVDYELATLEESYGPYDRGQVWADPDVDHAARLLRRLYEEEAYRREIGSAARASIRRQLAPEVIGRRYRERLQAVGRSL